MSQEATKLRDLIFEICALQGIGRGYRIVPAWQWQPEQAPAFGVYLKRERFVPDGDANTGTPKFINTATIGVSILVKASDGEALALASTIHGDLTEAAVLGSIELFDQIEGVEGVDRNTAFPSNGSAYWAETRIEFELLFRSSYPPELLDELRRLVVTTHLAGTDPDAPTLTTVIDLPET